MKTYRISMAGRVRAAAILVTLAIIFLYSSRKALGLWGGMDGKPSDPQLFNLNLNTTVPAILLTLVALGSIAAAWHIVVELISQVRVDESGILVNAPGYRLFYRWNEVAAVDVLNEPEDDMAAQLMIQLASPAGEAASIRPAVNQGEAPSAEDEVEEDDIAVFLSEADLLKDRAARQRQRQLQRQQLAEIQARAKRPDGRPLPYWLRLLYPQARHPDRIVLYPTLENRPALIAEIEQHLART